MLRFSPASPRAAWLLVVPGALLASCNIYNPSLLTGTGGATASTGSTGGASMGSTSGSSPMSSTNGPTTTGPTSTSDTGSATSSASTSATTSGTTTASSTSVSASASTSVSTSASTSVSTSAATTTTATTATTTVAATTTTGGCLSPATCPGMDTACQTRTCSAGMCGFSYQPSGTPTTDTTAGDCAKPVCDGAGNVTMVADATDPPTTTNQCQIGMCSGTTGSIGNKADGTACTQSGGNVCLSGSCVGCIASTDCPSLNCNASSCGPYVLISEVRTRGANGAADEFIELYNPLSTPVTLGADISILGRSSTATGYTTRWTGAGQVIPSHYHFLIGGTAYAGPPAADAALVNGLPDQMSLVLVQNVGGTNQVIDAFCFYCGTNPFDATFTCNGTPFNKPGCSSTTNYDAAERKPGGSLGNGTNTRNNSADFLITSPSNQRDLASAPLP